MISLIRICRDEDLVWWKGPVGDWIVRIWQDDPGDADDRIEAIAHNTLKIEGWMWHPEREVINHEAVQRDLKNFFSTKDEWSPTV